jgi:hypothetical protein
MSAIPAPQGSQAHWNLCKGRIWTASLLTPAKRCVTACRRLFQDDDASALKMVHNALGGYGGHIFVGAVDASTTLESKCYATASARSRG